MTRSCCPHCGGTGGIARDEMIPHTRYAGWDWKESEAQVSLRPVKAGMWTCVDCGHRFRKSPIDGMDFDG